MNNKIISTTITVVFYVALAATIFLAGRELLPIVTNTLTEILVTAAKAGEKQ